MSKEKRTVILKGKSYPKYEVSEDGKIFNCETGRELKMFDDDRGYDCVDIMDGSGNRVRGKVHLIVAHTFLGPQEEKMIVNHKNANKKDNKVKNLEYISQRANVAHAQVKVKGIEYISEAKRKKIKELRDKGLTLPKIAEKVNLKVWVVRDFLQGKTYNE